MHLHVMKFCLIEKIFLLMWLIWALPVEAAAPNDISSGLRLWLDGLDVDGDLNSTNNPANGATVSLWKDKSTNAYSAGPATSFSTQVLPTYVAGSGISFDGAMNRVLEVSTGIFGAGASVPQVEALTVATTRRLKQSFVFLSGPTYNTTNRISSHFPWSDGTIYWDHVCCGAGRLTASWAGTGSVLSHPYAWDLSASNVVGQKIIRNMTQLASDANSGVYTQNANNHFYIGGGENNSGNSHDGIISELIIYNRILTLAERIILNNYYMSKWNLADSMGANDKYAGDSAANGDFDYYVGGIGQDTGGSVTQGTSLGLTLINQTLLNANGDYVLAGLPSLAPATGTLTTDLPSSVSTRSARVWFLDVTNVGTAGGNIQASFSATQLGLTVANGDDFGLLYRATNSGNFSLLSQAQFGAGLVTFTLSNPLDGYYAIGRLKPSLIILKSVTPTTISSGGDMVYQVSVTNSGLGAASQVLLEDVLSPFVLWSLNTYSVGVAFQCSSGCGGSIVLGAPTYSNDNGGTFSYAPVSGGGGAPAGFDANVTHWKLPMTGTLSAGANFVLKYQTRAE